jgi:glycosyltransferase involved in cell wall biosynthesis
MNVIIVTDYGLINGGASKVALESAIALTEHIDQVHVFFTIGESASALKKVPNLRITQLNQTKITDLPITQSVLSGLWNKEAAKEFSKVLDLYEPKDTIVHVHSWRDGTTLSFIPEVQRRGFKLVFTAHDFGLACPIAGFFDHRTNSICHLKGLSSQCLKSKCTNTSIVKKSWFSLRHSLQVKKAHMPSNLKHLITVSALSEKVLQPYLNDGTKIHFVQNPIPIEKGTRIKAEQNENYAFVGRFSPEKGAILAARAAQAAGVPIMFIGTGPEAPDIRPICPEAQLLGWRKPAEVRMILQEARALIFPSVWYEVQGMVVDEAAALGIPVIVSDVTAAVEAVDRFKHGAIFESGNVDALVRRIKEFEHKDVVMSFSQEGFENYWNNPSTMKNHVDALLKVYDSILSQSSFVD